MRNVATLFAGICMCVASLTLAKAQTPSGPFALILVTYVVETNQTVPTAQSVIGKFKTAASCQAAAQASQVLDRTGNVVVGVVNGAFVSKGTPLSVNYICIQTE
jgi:hypothetical protein